MHVAYRHRRNTRGSILPPSDRGRPLGDASRLPFLPGSPPMELPWYGRTCIRMKGRDAVVVADPYQSVVGPTGRGISGDVITFSHPDPSPFPRAKGRRARDGKTHAPTSLD